MTIVVCALCTMDCTVACRLWIVDWTTDCLLKFCKLITMGSKIKSLRWTWEIWSTKWSVVFY